MNTSLVLSIGGIVVGSLGVFIAIYEFAKVKRVKSIVGDWGSDIYERLCRSANSLTDLHDDISSIDPVSWNQSSERIGQAVREQSESIKSISQSMRLFLRNAIGEREFIDERRS